MITDILNGKKIVKYIFTYKLNILHKIKIDQEIQNI